MLQIPILNIDIVGYARHSSDKRQAMHQTLQVELEQCARFFIPFGNVSSKLQRLGTGDGYYWLFDALPPQVALKYALDLDARLSQHNARYPELPIRLRMVLALGDVKQIGDQYDGQVLIEAARFLDDPRLRTYQDQVWQSQQAATVLAITNVFYFEWRKDPNRQMQGLKIEVPSWQEFNITDKHGSVHRGQVWDRDGWQAESSQQVILGEPLHKRPMHLVALSFESYKPFGDLHDLKLRPLTIFLGRNGAGKSAILRLVPLMLSALTEARDPGLPLSVDDVQYGYSFTDLIHNKHSHGSFTMGATFRDQEETWSFKARIQSLYNPERNRQEQVVAHFSSETNGLKDISLDWLAKESKKAGGAFYSAQLANGDQEQAAVTFHGLMPDLPAINKTWRDRLSLFRQKLAHTGPPQTEEKSALHNPARAPVSLLGLQHEFLLCNYMW